MKKSIITVSTALTCLIFGQTSAANEPMDPVCFNQYKSQYDEAHRDNAIPFFLKSSMYAGGSTLAAGTSTLVGSVALPAAGLGATGGFAAISEWIIGSVVMGVPTAGIGYEIYDASKISIDDLKLRSWIYDSLSTEIGAGIIGPNLTNIHANLVAYISVKGSLQDIRYSHRLTERTVTVDEVAVALEQIADKGLLCEMDSAGNALAMSSGKAIFHALFNSMAKNRGPE